MELIINRDSVCLGDDVTDHKKVFVLNDEATYDELFAIIIQEKYLPNVSGNNVVWVLSSADCFCIFSYFTRTKKMNMGLAEKQLNKICRNNHELIIKYYSSPRKWREKIVEVYEGDTHAMWHDGWGDELKYCDYVMALGEESI